MPKTSLLMRCLYCGMLQDEPAGVKACQRCGGELAFELPPPPDWAASYLEAQMELDQVMAPAGRALDRYLLVTLRTPKSLPPDQAASPGRARPALHFTAVLDVSGSMSGEKLSFAKQALRQALRHLGEGDHLSLVVFSDEVRCILEPSAVGPEATRRVDSVLQELAAGGMTALCGGLELGIEQARRRISDNNLVLLLSDGQANVGETGVEQVGTRGRLARRDGLTISTLGVGQDYNEALMVEIATQGGGRFYHLQDAAQIVPFLTGELGQAANLAAREAKVHLNLPAAAVVVPLTAAYSAEQAAGRATITVGDIPCDVELEVPLRLTLFDGRPGDRPSVAGEVGYRSPAGRRLATSLNRVTVRFVKAAEFELRAGVVLPVAERVARQLHAAQVLEVSRAMALDPQEAGQKVANSRRTLHEYARLLGDSPAAREIAGLDAEYEAMRASPRTAKQSVAAAYRRQSSTKDFQP